ncbi:MAG TPA: hypothetical protein DCY32_04610 [Opitutae bacterium]|nr:hypothetical protein [Opitutae bacterium]
MKRFVVVFLALGSLFGESADWSRFRGPGGQGKADWLKLPKKFHLQKPSWTLDLPGVGHSSPVLFENKIFTTCANPESGLRNILCVDADDGKILWKRDIQSTPDHRHKFNSHASSTPAADQDFVFLSWTTRESNNLICLDHLGQKVWQRDFGAFETQHGSGFSPIVFRDKVVVTHDHETQSFVYCLDRKTGKTLWKTARKGSKPSASTPVAHLSKSGQVQFVCNSKSHGCFALDGRTGKVLWETGPDTLDLRSVSSPFLTPGGFFASCGSGGRGSRMLAVQPPSGNQKKAIISYKITRNVPYVPTPLAFDDLVFTITDAGIATCIEAKSGTLLWMERVGGNFFASPIAVSNQILITSREGVVTFLDISSEGMTIRGQLMLGELTHATPAVGRDSLFFRTFSKLHCFRATSSRI